MKKNRTQDAEKELNNLAVFVHGSLSALHTLGMIYNLKRKNYLASVIHGVTGV